MDALVAALAERDGFLRFKVVAAIGGCGGAIRQLTFPRAARRGLICGETSRYYNYLTLALQHHARTTAGEERCWSARARRQAERTLDRIYRLLACSTTSTDVAAARYTIEHGDARRRAGAVEYLDNLLTGTVRSA